MPWDMLVFDDGHGPRLYVTGTGLSNVPPGRTKAVQRWDGYDWEPVGGGLVGTTDALAVFDDGGGPALYAAGTLRTAPGQNIVRWDGADRWDPVGMSPGGRVYCLQVFDDGGGPSLYAGGPGVWEWDGQAWSERGELRGGACYTFAVFDDGNGPALHAGGEFTTEQGEPVNGVARWEDQRWVDVGGGVGGTCCNVVGDLAVFDDGTGGSLYACGTFTTAGAAAVNNVAKWDGRAWSSPGTGLTGGVDLGARGIVRSLAVHDDGSGPRLFAAGVFNRRGGSTNADLWGMAGWDGREWSEVSGGVCCPNGTLTLAAGQALESVDLGSGPTLLVSGSFGYAGGFPHEGGVRAYPLAAWNGEHWSSFGRVGFDSEAMALAVYDDGSGPCLYAAGAFLTTGAVDALRIARWDGHDWHAVGGGIWKQSTPSVGQVAALTAFGDSLIAGGLFDRAGGVVVRNVAAWNGTAWRALGLDMVGSVAALKVYDDGTGPALYGAVNAHTTFVETGVHRWDGQRWQRVGLASGGHNTPWMAALEVHDDGSGPALYAGGGFARMDAVIVYHVARWDGAAWASLGGGIDPGSLIVRTLRSHNDGTGPALYAGGDFDTLGSPYVGGLARWDGSRWTNMNVGPGASVWALEVANDGGGPALFAGGRFAGLGGVPANNVARWNGRGWQPLGLGTGPLGSIVKALCGLEDPAGPSVFLGGDFQTAGGANSGVIAQWTGCRPCYPDCDVSSGIGVLDVADFLCFQGRYLALDPYACDCETATGQGVCDIFDFLCFQNAYAAGCP